MARQVDAQQEQMNERFTKLEKNTEEIRMHLSMQLTEETSQVRRSAADLGVEIDALKEQIALLQGQIAQFQNALEITHRTQDARNEQLNEKILIFAQRAGIDMPIDKDVLPETKSEHFSQALQFYNLSNYSKARAFFRAYIERFPQDEQADDAQYWIGSSYLQEQRPATALDELRKIISNYSTSDVLDQTLYAMAEAFLRLKACTEAKAALEALVKTVPSSPLVKNVRTMKRKIRSMRKQCVS